MGNYSAINKILHKLYLSNHFISRSTFDLEIEVFGNRIKKLDLQSVVFVSGLARSGTTSFMRTIHETNNFASLQYNNMPFLFLPNIWKNKSNLKTQERAHNDGIKINSESPEEFDEYFWKVFLKENYINNDRLIPHPIADKELNRYIDYIKLICLSKNQSSYITKNNNSILRINSLREIPNSHFFFLVRSPFDHASSLLKLHHKFSEDHKDDPFSLEYFNFLGHYEFGLNHKPFCLIDKLFYELKSYDIFSIEYWLLIWKQYYSYLLDNLSDDIHIVLFEDLIQRPGIIYDFVSKKLGLNMSIPTEGFVPPSYKRVDSNVLTECETLYAVLKTKVKYS